jgi:hypothetical protein
MRRFAFLTICVAILLVCAGCSICAAPDDEAYPAYGGIVERHDPYRGRVGSAFDSGVSTVSHLQEFDGESWRGEESSEAFDAPPTEEVPAPAPQGDDEGESFEEEGGSREAPTAPEVYYE